ncbi:tyrosine-type recombinase/integrase [Limosilactobacillus antri]|uniref:tyrosine-type recombinase/integrase n=1 Tax=Limosilactobacillus antri TaxID=227943 RepID=UPI001F56EC90|nr:site-specific integrase [Limosilactobacillus antri]
MWVETYTVKGKARYRFVERYKSSLSGRYKRVSISYGKDTAQVRKMATKELAEKIRNALALEGASIKDATILQLKEKFFKQYKQQVRISTWTNADILLRDFIKTIGPDAHVQNVTTIWLNRYLSKLLYDKELTNGTVRAVKSKINQLFKFALNYGYIKENPMDKVNIKWKDERQKRFDQIENKYLTHEEYRAIIRDCVTRKLFHYADAFQLQYLTGLRFGELAALQVKNVIHTNNKVYLYIHGTMLFLKNPPRHIITDEAKSFAGNRQIILSPAAISIVNKHCSGKEPTALLFAINENAKKYNDQRPLNTSNADSLLKRIAKRQGIDKVLTTHYFRHTHVSILADMGVPLRIIKKRVGHSKSDITQQIYLHVTKEAQNDFEDRIADIDLYK